MKKFLNTFDAIFYINRLEDVERNTHIQNTFGNNGVKLIRVDAVTPQNTDLNSIINFNINRHDKQPYHITETSEQRLKEACCSMSHAKAWDSAFRMGLSNVLIIEDDVILSVTDEEQLTHYTQSIPKDSHITYYNYLMFSSDCGSWLTERGYFIDVYSRNVNWNRVEGGAFSTSAYSINLDLFRKEDFNKIITQMMQGVIADFFFSSYLQQNICCYIPTEKIFKCSDKFESTIGDNYKCILQAYENDATQTNYVWGDLTDPFDYQSNKYKKRFSNYVDAKYLTIMVGGFLYDDFVIQDDTHQFPIDSITEEFSKIDLPIKIFITEYNAETTENGKYPNNGKKTYLFNHKPKNEMGSGDIQLVDAVLSDIIDEFEL